MRKIKFLCLIESSILSCLFLVSCSQPKTTTKAENSPALVVSLPDKAEKVCGDRLPEDPASYPVSFYSVSVEYSADNLSKIKNHFCEDALPRTSKSLGREVVQVASFTSKEKADSFKVKLSQYFGQVTIGEPTVIEKSKNNLVDKSVVLDKHPLTGQKFPTWCSDSTPGEQTGETIEFYPVYIDYSEIILNQIREDFCTSVPIKVFRQDKNIDTIDVAHFTSKYRAIQFKEYFKRRFLTAEVGNPIKIESPKDMADLFSSEHYIRESTTSFPLISEGQLKQLKQLVGDNNIDKINFQVALPTWLPDGFTISNIDIREDKKFPPGYNMKYKSATSCILLSGDNGQWGGDPRSHTTLNIYSAALGNVRLDYNNFDRVSDHSYVFLRKSLPSPSRAKMTYSITSCEKGISLSEITKIIKSIKFVSKDS